MTEPRGNSYATKRVPREKLTNRTCVRMRVCTLKNTRIHRGFLNEVEKFEIVTIWSKKVSYSSCFFFFFLMKIDGNNL